MITTLVSSTLAFFSSAGVAKPIPVFPLELVASRTHDHTLFTQGLVVDQGVFYESGGLYQRSRLVRYDTEKKRTQALDDHLFAEGLTVMGDTLYLLTWKAETLLTFNKHTLAPGKTLHYSGEGWGLTHNHQHLIMSNGSNRLSFHRPSDFAIEKTLTVKGLDRLNELDYSDGIIWANRWYNDHIYAIDSHSGCILGKIDLSRLRQQAVSARNLKNVTNGIAYDADNNGLWVTGKYWHKMFLIKRPQLAAPTC